MASMEYGHRWEFRTVFVCEGTTESLRASTTDCSDRAIRQSLVACVPLLGCEGAEPSDLHRLALLRLRSELSVTGLSRVRK